MKSFKVIINTAPSGLWLLDEKELLHFVLSPAMEYAQRNGLRITEFHFKHSVITISFGGAVDMLRKFLSEYEWYLEYALSQLKPDYSNNALKKPSGIIQLYPPLSATEELKDEFSLIESMPSHPRSTAIPSNCPAEAPP